MRALSIKQPWAWLIIYGGKDIENRTWTTAFRGTCYVHASKALDIQAYKQLVADGVTLPTRAELLEQQGGIIGTIDITDCVQSHASQWFTGPNGFVLANPVSLPFRPMRGQLNFFTVTE